jgi:hypothetical protein
MRTPTLGRSGLPARSELGHPSPGATGPEVRLSINLIILIIFVKQTTYWPPPPSAGSPNLKKDLKISNFKND